jgi:hypothetical protein
MFTPEEIAAQLTRIEHERNEKDEDVRARTIFFGRVRRISWSALGSS